MKEKDFLVEYDDYYGLYYVCVMFMFKNFKIMEINMRLFYIFIIIK